MKQCKHCGCKITDHYKGKPWSCKPCVRAKAKEWRDANPDKCSSYGKKKHDLHYHTREKWRQIEKKYGITQAEYTALLTAQGGHCAICPATEKLVVEHNHATGEVRGIVCRSCNTALGMSGDSPSRLLGLAQYLLNRGHYGPQ